MHGRSGEPGRLRAVTPFRELFRHRHIADEPSAGRVILPLQRQRLVIDEPAGARELAHLARLLAGRPEFESEGLESLHHSEATIGP